MSDLPPLPELPLRPKSEATIGQPMFEAMREAASRLDWGSYLAMAEQAGGFSPLPTPGAPPSDARAALRALDIQEAGPFESALNDIRREPGPAEALLSSLRAHFPPERRIWVFDWLLRCDPRDSAWLCLRPLAEPLILLGADPIESGAAAMAANSGCVESLAAMLAAGMDPNAQPEGSMPLIFEALAKERSHGMSLKMEAVQLLFEHGASFSAHLSGSVPSSLLELVLLGLAFPEAQAACSPKWLREFRTSPAWLPALSVSIPYLEELWLGPVRAALLPDPDDADGLERIAGLLDGTRPGAQSAAPSLAAHPWLSEACQAAMSARERLALGSSIADGLPAAQRSL